MDQPEANLADIPTRWSIVLNARQAAGDTAAAARHELLVRYHQAVLRYLRLKMHDDHAAGQVYSDFALRVLEVDPFVRRSDPARGRFRFYLMAVLRRMIADYYRRPAPRPVPVDVGIVDPPAGGAPDPSALDGPFIECWRQELINHAWAALERVERDTGQPYATLVRLKEQQPDLRTAALTELAAKQLGRTLTADNARKIIQRGREQFAQLLVAEAARSLRTAPDEVVERSQVEAELIELGLLNSYCRAALAAYAQRG